MPLERQETRLRDPDWFHREALRFRSGEYLQVPWADEDWRWFRQSPEHLAWDERDRLVHISVKDPTMVAFTASRDHGELDRQTRMKPGKYLKRFYGHFLSEREIADWSARFGAENAPKMLQFADTADDIEWVYVNGPSSCMSRDAGGYSSNEHPVRVYAAGDLQVAYITRDNSTGEDGEPTARVLCWPERRLYGRIYGDAARIAPLLEAAGYTQGSLRGARLLRIEEDDGLVCPYIDGDGSVSDDGEYLRIGGDYDATSTNGILIIGRYCPCCGEYQDEVGFSRVDDAQESWCEGCVDNRTWTCAASGEVYSDNAYRLELAEGGYIHSSNNDGYWCCGGTREWYSHDDPSYEARDADGTEILICERMVSAYSSARGGLLYEAREDEYENTVYVHWRYLDEWNDAHGEAHEDQIELPLEAA